MLQSSNTSFPTPPPSCNEGALDLSAHSMLPVSREAIEQAKQHAKPPELSLLQRLLIGTSLFTSTVFSPSCTAPGIRSLDTEVNFEKFPEIALLDPTIERKTLMVITPANDATIEDKKKYRKVAIEFGEHLKNQDPNLIYDVIDEPGLYNIRAKMYSMGNFENVEIGGVIRITCHKPSQPLDDHFRISAQLTDFSALSLFRSPINLARPFKARIFVADGAFKQGETASMSTWTKGVANVLQKNFEGLDLSVYALSYTERSSIRSSAKVLANLIVQNLEQQPLQEDEEIIFMGHSQGAFVLSYLLNTPENELPMNLPHDRIRGFISFDLPFNVIKDYDSYGYGIVNPLLFIARNDPLIFPILNSVFFPAGNDWLGNTTAYDRVKEPHPLEIRIQRTFMNGKPVNPTIAGSSVDDVNSQYEHDPFSVSYLPQSRIIRERLIRELIYLLPIEITLEEAEAN